MLTVTVLVHAGEDVPAITPVEVTVIPFVIGREPDCDLVIEDERASRHHAQLELQPDGRVVLRDLESTNGTFADEHRVVGGTWLTLPADIRIGRTTLRVALRLDAGRTVVESIPPALPVGEAVQAPVSGPAGSPAAQGFEERAEIESDAVSEPAEAPTGDVVPATPDQEAPSDAPPDGAAPQHDAAPHDDVNTEEQEPEREVPDDSPVSGDSPPGDPASEVVADAAPPTPPAAMMMQPAVSAPPAPPAPAGWAAPSAASASTGPPPPVAAPLARGWGQVPAGSPPAAAARGTAFAWIGAIGMVIAALSALAAPATVGTIAVVPIGLLMALPAVGRTIQRVARRLWIVPVGLFAVAAGALVIVFLSALFGLDALRPMLDPVLYGFLSATLVLAIAAAIATRGLPLAWSLVAIAALLFIYGLVAWDATSSRSWEKSTAGLIMAAGLGWIALDLAAQGLGKPAGTAFGAGWLARRGQNAWIAGAVGSVAIAVLIGLLALSPLVAYGNPAAGRPEPQQLAGPGIGKTGTTGTSLSLMDVTLLGATRIAEVDEGGDRENIDHVYLRVTCLYKGTGFGTCDADDWVLIAGGTEVDSGSGFETVNAGETVPLEIRFFDVPQDEPLEVRLQGPFDDAPVLTTTLQPVP